MDQFVVIIKEQATFRIKVYGPFTTRGEAAGFVSTQKLDPVSEYMAGRTESILPLFAPAAAPRALDA